MKICYVLNSPHWGGMEWHVVYLAEGMLQKGHEVFVWCPEGGNLVSEFEKVGTTVIPQKIKYDIDPEYIFKLAKFLREKKIDIVHGHELKAVTNSLIAGFLAGTKTRISHTHTPISEWQISSFKKSLNAFGYAHLVNMLATYEIALTLSRKRVKINEGIREAKLKIIKSANGVKPERFAVVDVVKKQYRSEILKRHHIPGDSFVWGTIGRISEEKGHLVLLEAFQKFFEGHRDHYLLLVGGGPLEKTIRDKIAGTDFEKHVIITGRFETDDQPKYFNALDVFVHPSLAEGWGITLVEAMMSGVPVLASDLEVFKEVAEDHVAYFSKGDFLNLLEKMKIISGKIPNFASAQQFAVDHYSCQKFVDEYEEFYKRALNTV